MASSRRWSPADALAPAHGSATANNALAGDSATLPAAVDAALARHAPDGARIAVALSGGRDSVALFDAAVDLAPARGLVVTAIHIHHGLSPHADAWARLCAELCAARDVPLIERRVDVARGARKSIEAEARRSRYAALSDAAIAVCVHAVLLAHHQDDQAETVLLQLLRGAGPHGLAAMPSTRTDAVGMLWLRPLLDVPRAVIDAYISARELHFVDDESNADTRYARNALRARVVPALASVASGYPATVARAARLQAEAAALIDDLAAIDAKGAYDGATLSRDALRALPEHRGRNLLRWFLRQRGLPPPSARRLDAMYTQLRDSTLEPNIRPSHAGTPLSSSRPPLVLPPPLPPFDLRWNGETTLALPHGALGFVPVRGRDCGRASRPRTYIRSRHGGERIQLAASGPPARSRRFGARPALPNGRATVSRWCGAATRSRRSPASASTIGSRQRERPMDSTRCGPNADSSPDKRSRPGRSRQLLYPRRS
jgi:tRNA(Ile)-lysidine synthase